MAFLCGPEIRADGEAEEVAWGSQGFVFCAYQLSCTDMILDQESVEALTDEFRGWAAILCNCLGAINIYKTYIHTYIHACMHACIHTYIHTYIHTCIHTYACMHAYIHTYIHSSIYVYIYIHFTYILNTHIEIHHIYIHMNRCMSVYVYIYIYIYIYVCRKVNKHAKQSPSINLHTAQSMPLNYKPLAREAFTP